MITGHSLLTGYANKRMKKMRYGNKTSPGAKPEDVWGCLWMKKRGPSDAARRSLSQNSKKQFLIIG